MTYTRALANFCCSGDVRSKEINKEPSIIERTFAKRIPMGEDRSRITDQTKIRLTPIVWRQTLRATALEALQPAVLVDQKWRWTQSLANFAPWNSLLCRESTGKICEVGSKWLFCGGFSAPLQVRADEFPVHWSREICVPNRVET